ncbi:MAG: AcrB/AcrD/AcrF family protein [Betaproteobacteria bacterium HGW-Betaproteobacteria-14]|nr:MAG: AcrB/AcrD/AcrF family protein [Betaproteobacteria bacterium HGW-Betaproteobacteria-14]
MKFVTALIRNHPFANITFAVVMVMGLFAYLTMPREQDPEINFNWVIITTTVPGASAEDVEKRVTKPLEDGIKLVADTKFVASNSRENVSSILVRFNDISERTFDKRMNDLRREIDNKANTELPPEAKDPRVLEITTSNGFATAMVMVTGEADDEQLRSAVRDFRDDLERIPGVDRVYAIGLHEPELLVEFDPHAAQSRGIAPGDIADAINAWFRDTFAGKARAGDTEWMVRILGTSADPGHLARLSVAPAANPRGQVPLDAIAEVSRTRAKPERLASTAGKPAVVLSVTKKSGINTLELVERVNDYIAERNPLIAERGLRAALLDDQTIPTRNAIGIMQTNALFGLATVLLVSWLFLGTRIAGLVGLGIPFSLAGTFAVLYALDFTLNISVLLGVVIALGMLVDDAVVVVEAIYYRVTRGQPVLEAAVDALREVAAPVTAAVATTMAAFLPLMLLPGIVGKFMFVIPAVVTLALAMSLVEAYWMLPAHVSGLKLNFDDPSRLHARRVRFTHWLRVKYARLLIKVMRHPALSGLFMAAVVAVAFAVVGAGLVRTQFFAFDPIRLFYVNVDMPPGTPIEATLRAVESVEQRLGKHLQPGELRAMASVAGFKYTDTEPLYGDVYGQVIVSLSPRVGDMRETDEVVAAARADIEGMAGPGKTSFTMISGGPPLSKAIRVRARNDDPVELRAAADALLGIVRAIKGSRDVVDDDVPGRPELVLTLDREAVRNAGLNPAQVARHVRLAVDGEIVASMRDRGEKLEVRVRARPVPGADIVRLLDTPLALPGGGSTTLGALTRYETQAGKGIIKHYNLRRAIAVEADLDREANDAVTANEEIKREWEKVRTRYPNTDLDFSGELDDIQESLDAMKVLFLFGLGLIYLILAAQFRSYWQPLMILVTVPLAFTGVVFGLLVSLNPLSLYTLYGVIALTGIAVNSAIVLIAAANDRMQLGMGALHAAVYAARRRVVPIIITSVTTIGGLFSLAVGLGGKSLIWGPMAASIVWGLGFATALTLFVVPLLYWVFMRPRAPRRGRLLRRFSFGAKS